MRSSKFVRVLMLVALAGVAGVGVVHGWSEPDGASKPCLVLNLTSGKEDLHSVTMALQLAHHALDDGRAAVLFLNVRGAELARKDLSPALKLGSNPPVGEMLAKLIERGGTVIACPACMEVMGVKSDDLATGVQMANRSLLFGRLGPDTAVFTY